MDRLPFGYIRKPRERTRVSRILSALLFCTMAFIETGSVSAQWHAYTSVGDDIVAIDTSTHAVVGVVHIPILYGFRVTPDGTFAVAASETHWELVDLASMTGADVNTHPPGLSCLDLMSVAVSHNGTRVYATYSECINESFAVLNLLTGEWRSIALDWPRGIIMMPDNASAYVVLEEGVVAVDTESLEVTPTELYTITSPYAFTHDGAFLFDATYSGIDVIDTKRHSIVTTIPVNAGAGGIAFSPDGALCYAAGLAEGAPVVWVIDTASFSLVDTIEVLAVGKWLAIRPDGVLGYVAGIDQDGVPIVTVFDTTTGAFVTRIELERLTRAKAFRPDGAFLYTPGPSGTVAVIDASANTLAKPISVGGLAFDMRVAPSPDPDGDGVGNGLDNCLAIANADQRDTDGDNIGNICDADFNGDCIVNAQDLGFMRSVFFSAEADADINGDGTVNVIDLGHLRQSYFMPPGPSGQPNECD